MKDIWELAKANEAYIIDRRRYYHAHPEPSMQEVETTKAIAKDLEALGIEYKTFPDHTGVLGVIRGGKPGKGIMLRADIDGLSGVHEATGLPFASQNPDCMHACGHDTHISVLLGAAKILNEIKDELCGTINLCFEPAEETLQGASLMIKDGCLDGMDACFGMHTWSAGTSGKASFMRGNIMAAGGKFTVRVKGYAAHGARPQDGHDAIIAACSIAMNLQTYVSRRTDPLNPVVLTIGTIHGGARWNVIANEVVMEGTLRTFDAEVRKNLKRDLSQIVEHTGKALGVEATLEYEERWPPTINADDEMLSISRNAAVKLFGEDALEEQPPTMGGESFSLYLERIPGTYGFMGSRDEVHCYGNHNEKFDIDESILKRSVALFVQVTVDFLNKDAK